MSPPGLHVNLTGQRMSGWGEPVRRCVRRMRITPRAAVLGYPQKLKFLRRSVTGTSMNNLGRGYVGWNPPQVQRGGCLGGEAPSLTPSLRCFLISIWGGCGDLRGIPQCSGSDNDIRSATIGSPGRSRLVVSIRFLSLSRIGSQPPGLR